MNSDYYLRNVQRFQAEIGRLQQEKSREAIKAVDDQKRANASAEAARKATNRSTADSRLREVERYNTSIIQHHKKIAEIEAKIARAQSQLNDAEKQLARARADEDRRRQQAEQMANRVRERNLATIARKLSDHDNLHMATIDAINRLQQLPEKITVLFLAANPLDLQQLRLDEEVRAIGEMIRKAEHRDSVCLESRWAVRPLDVLHAINECQPRIVHFSGHGSEEDEIVFQDNSGHAKLVSKEAIVQTMAAGSDSIQLVFFNTCYSRSQAEAVVQHVPAAIGMNTSIGDTAARVFSAQFYSSIGFGLSVGRAFQQAKAALMLEGIPEESTPELFTADGLLADDLVLVRPEER